MEIRPFPSARHAAHDLTKAEGFALGPLTVDPPARRLIAGEKSDMLEPRVMQVLVALGGAGGRVLSREDLIELCWDGLVVGDNAINRVIFRLRHALEDLSGGVVRLETIPRVGFRLVVDGETASAAPLPDPLLGIGGSVPASIAPVNMPAGHRRWTRRATVFGLVAAGGTAAIGTAAWFKTRQHTPDPRAVELYRRGQAIQKAGVLESRGAALDAYKQALAIDPRYADAWGALALSYRLGTPMRLSDPQEVRAAAQRALALDPGNADAQLALIMLYPYYGRWQEREARLRGFLRDHPDSALGHARLGWLLFNVGRIEDAANLAQRAIDLDAALQTCWLLAAHAYYYAGRDGEGDTAIEEARSRWPQDYLLYANGYFFLFDGKRYAAALAYLRETSRRPRMLRPEITENWMHQADAFATGRGLAELKDGVRALPQPASVQIQTLELAAPGMALLGLVDELFALYEAYFFGGMINSTRVPAPGPLDPRFNATLFAPALAGLRNDPRFASLLERTGLEDYWRRSGTQPDFRRAR